MIQALQSGDEVGQPAAGRRSLPTFIIIGAAKAGTTSLYYYLEQHPDVFMSPVKETNFFLSDGGTVSTELDAKGTARPTTDVNSLSGYQALFSEAMAQKALGEASPKYLYYPDTARRIKAQLPDVKIIVVLRNPVDRAYSSFLQQVRDNQEEVTDFATALRKEPERIEQGWSSKYHYRNRGFYFKQLAPYYATFDPANIHVYLFEDLQKDPLGLLRHAFTFLGVDASFEPNLSAKHNISGVPKNRLLHGVYSFLKGDNRSPVKALGKQFLPAAFRQQIKGQVARNIQQKNLGKPPLSPEVREDLLWGYREDILQLQTLIDRDLTRWLK